MTERRVTMLGASLRRYEDPALSADPGIRRLVAQLATLEPEPAPVPRSHFRAELRTQLVAVAPRLVAEGPAVERADQGAARASRVPATKTPRVKPWPTLGRPGTISIARAVAAFGAIIAVFVVLLGGAVWISQKALPGDALYGLKRADENVALSLASGDTAKGRKYLRLAQTRAGEVSALLSRSSATAYSTGRSAAAGINTHTAHLITVTLDSADSDTRSGSQLLGGQAARNGSAYPLSVMIGWAPSQIERIRSITGRLGSGALRDRAAASTELAVSAFSRARTLTAGLACDCLEKRPTDDLGPLPCKNCTTVPTPRQQPAPAPAPTNPATSSTNGATAPNPGSTTTVGTGATTATVTVPTASASASASASLPVTDGGSTSVDPSTSPITPSTLPITPPTLPVEPPTPPTEVTPGAANGQACALSVATCLP